MRATVDKARPLMEMGLTSADLLQPKLQMNGSSAVRCVLIFFEANCVDKVVAYFSKGAVAAPEKQVPGWLRCNRRIAIRN